MLSRSIFLKHMVF